jgi:hypothetical protein
VVVVGDTCTPTDSPFNLHNVSADSSTASFRVSGNVTDGVGPASVFTGTFSTQFDDQNYQEVLALFLQQGFVQAPYSAQFTVRPSDFTPVIPEPASILLFGAGILGLGLIKRRRSNAA